MDVSFAEEGVSFADFELTSSKRYCAENLNSLKWNFIDQRLLDLTHHLHCFQHQELKFELHLVHGLQGKRYV